MTGSIEISTGTIESELIESIRWELEALSLGVKKESFRAKQELKNKVKELWFYDWDESWENINFNIINVRKYLEWIRNKTWSELNIKSSELEKWVRTIAIQIAINYINNKNWGTSKNIDWIDGIRGNQTWNWVKEFQTTYGLKNKDGFPWPETINKILELLWSNLAFSNSNNGVNRIADSNVTQNRQEHFMNRHKNIDDDKCIRLFRSMKIPNRRHWFNVENSKWSEFIEKVKTESESKWGLEKIIFGDSQVQNLLVNVLNEHWKDIAIRKSNYLQKKQSEINPIWEDMIDSENEEVFEFFEDYKYKNETSENFEQFVLSDEWRAIIMYEIKSHVNTHHTNNNNEYDEFYNNYPLSAANLEIELKNAFDKKIQSDYYKKFGHYDEKKDKLDILANQVTLDIKNIVANHMKSGKNDFDPDIRLKLRLLLSKEYDGATISKIISDKDYEDTFKIVLSEIIENYENRVRNNNDIDLNTDDKQISLQLKSYLYIYWNIFYSEDFKSDQDSQYYEELLPEVMLSILSNNDASLETIIKHKKFLILERKLEQERRKRDQQRKALRARRNEEKNNSIQPGKIKEFAGIDESQIKSIDPDNAPWYKIAASAGLSDDFEDYNVEVKEFKEKENRIILENAWKDFTQYNSDIKPIISIDDMYELYDFENNTIRESNENDTVRKSADNRRWEQLTREEFIKSNMAWKSSEEIKKIHDKLQSFPAYFEKAKQGLSSSTSQIKEAIGETVKTYAIWAVIDNVRDIFNTIVSNWQTDAKFEWFTFSQKPVKREWNNIEILWKFNWSDVKIRYNLETGKIFMNSFIQHKSTTKLTIWNSINADYEIGELKSFDKILEEHYSDSETSASNTDTPNIPKYTLNNRGNWRNWNQRSGTKNWFNLRENIWPLDNMPDNTDIDPRHRHWPIPPIIPHTTMWKEEIDLLTWRFWDMINVNLDLISNSVIEHTKKQNAMNSLIMKFMKTFNIISWEDDASNIDINDGSNMFKLIQIIENSEPNTLNKFQIFMEKIMEYSWLKWWSNNILWAQKNTKTSVIFDEVNNNHLISLLRDNADNFSKNPQEFKNIKNFDSNSNLWFVDMIVENITTDNSNKSNQKLDGAKMRTFFENAKLDSPF